MDRICLLKTSNILDEGSEEEQSTSTVMNNFIEHGLISYEEKDGFGMIFMPLDFSSYHFYIDKAEKLRDSYDSESPEYDIADCLVLLMANVMFFPNITPNEQTRAILIGLRDAEVIEFVETSFGVVTYVCSSEETDDGISPIETICYFVGEDESCDSELIMLLSGAFFEVTPLKRPEIIVPVDSVSIEDIFFLSNMRDMFKNQVEVTLYKSFYYISFHFTEEQREEIGNFTVDDLESPEEEFSEDVITPLQMLASLQQKSIGGSMYSHAGHDFQ